MATELVTTLPFLRWSGAAGLNLLQPRSDGVQAKSDESSAHQNQGKVWLPRHPLPDERASLWDLIRCWRRPEALS